MMKLTKKKMIAGAAAISCFAMLATGCATNSGAANRGADLPPAQTDQGGRETIKKPEKVITVIDKPVQVSKIEVSGIVTIDNARGMNFFGGSKLIVSHPNLSVEPIQGEGEKVQPNNIYVYDMEKKTEEALVPGSENQGFSELSPDGSYLFYKMTEEGTGFGRILDMKTKKSISLGDEPVDLNSGQWLDNDHVLFSTIFGKIVVADTNGTMKTIAEHGGYVHSAVVAGGNLYYVKGESSDLYSMALQEGAKPEKIGTGVDWVVPSPDGKQLALVKHKSETVRTLSVVDLKGNELLKLASATQIFGTRWSPDGTKLAYSLTSEENGGNGIFVADALTGEATSVLVEQASDTLNWDASGTKLLTSAFKENRFVTSVITLK
ncbi:hypothetical protein [Paenibacillus sp. NPDC058071]|uniref:hypothetical protein n=1 Tax=Paenibacillus sp. NPDC058071 TaxID=3346326 RepID=UPI0036D7736A